MKFISILANYSRNKELTNHTKLLDSIWIRVVITLEFLQCRITKNELI